MGLQLNHNKCEVITKSASNYPSWISIGLNFRETPIEEATLLGTLLSTGAAVDSALAGKRTDLEVLIKRLALIPSHAALFLLKNALAIPKLLYLLRTAPALTAQSLDAMTIP